jgi:hypothetical protein
VALLTDGATRAVTLFHRLDWASLFGVLADEGPRAVLREVRQAEREDQGLTRWPRTKGQDDATALFIEPSYGW